jgi:hypothetical protein
MTATVKNRIGLIVPPSVHWGFYFRIVDDAYRILKLIPHPKK